MNRAFQILFIGTITILAIHFFSFNVTQEPDFNEKRKRMVEYQIKNRGIRDEKVLNAFMNVERHLFVLEKYIDHAYSDRALPIESGQTISQPYVVAFMTDVLAVKRNEKVLEIGTGSGYQAAILGEICDHVFTIEIDKFLGEKSAKLLKELGYNNINTRTGDGYQGWPEAAPFDAIIVTCSPSKIPKPLQDQLAEGGRMIIPVGNKGYQQLILLKKVNGKVKAQEVLPVAFVPMVDSDGNRY